LSVDLDHPHRLIFLPDHDPVPLLPDGGLDWSRVTAIMIQRTRGRRSWRVLSRLADTACCLAEIQSGRQARPDPDQGVCKVNRSCAGYSRRQTAAWRPNPLESCRESIQVVLWLAGQL